MSFTVLLLLAYAVMIAGAFIAFQRRHKAIGIVFLLVMVLSILILGYPWIHSPCNDPFTTIFPFGCAPFCPSTPKKLLRAMRRSFFPFLTQYCRTTATTLPKIVLSRPSMGW